MITSAPTRSKLLLAASAATVAGVLSGCSPTQRATPANQPAAIVVAPSANAGTGSSSPPAAPPSAPSAAPSVVVSQAPVGQLTGSTPADVSAALAAAQHEITLAQQQLGQANQAISSTESEPTP